MLIGYVRVSTGDQNLDLQKQALEDVGCKKIFEDKLSGSKAIHRRRWLRHRTGPRQPPPARPWDPLRGIGPFTCPIPPVAWWLVGARGSRGRVDCNEGAWRSWRPRSPGQRPSPLFVVRHRKILCVNVIINKPVQILMTVAQQIGSTSYLPQRATNVHALI